MSYPSKEDYLISSQEVVKERWDFAVLTVMPAPKNPKEKFKFQLNAAAKELFPISKDTKKRVSLVTTLEDPKAWILADCNSPHYSGELFNNGSFGNKTVYEALTAALELDSSKENYFRLMKLELTPQYVTYKLEALVTEVKEESLEVEEPVQDIPAVEDKTAEALQNSFAAGEMDEAALL
jgi:hypothetical protein